MKERIDERDLALARVYARSLLGLAEERRLADELGGEMQELVALLDRVPALERFVGDPFVDAEGRRQVVEKILRGGLSDLLVDGLQVMNRKGRLGLVRALAEAYRLELEELRGEVDVEVVTAVPLDEAQRESLAEAATRYSGRRAKLVERVDESILGGMMVKIGDRKIDTSLAKELRQLGARLVERASKEIHGGRRFYVEADQEGRA